MRMYDPDYFVKLESHILIMCSMLLQKAVSVLIRRSGTDGLTALRLVPRQGWGGRGSLGYAS